MCFLMLGLCDDKLSPSQCVFRRTRTNRLVLLTASVGLEPPNGLCCRGLVASPMTPPRD